MNNEQKDLTIETIDDAMIEELVSRLPKAELTYAKKKAAAIVEEIRSQLGVYENFALDSGVLEKVASEVIEEAMQAQRETDALAAHQAILDAIVQPPNIDGIMTVNDRIQKAILNAEVKV